MLHNGDTQGTYPMLNNAPKYQVGERIRVILDCEDKTLSFEKNFEFLGIAFKGGKWRILRENIFFTVLFFQSEIVTAIDLKFGILGGIE